ncbi:MAG TPA: ABC transporter ATP-binding protein/permease [Firmicutes bacterium]|nr:ABC transporter ATP-binding protein/permease [Bacillota bacterium]
MNKRLPKSNLLSLSFLTKGSRGHFLLAFVLVILAVITGYLTPQVFRITVDSVLGDEPFSLPGALVSLLESWGGREALRQNLLVCALAALLFSLFSGLFNFGARLAIAHGTENTIKRLRDRLFDHIQKLPYAWYAKNQTGDVIQRCTSDVDTIRNFLIDQSQEMVRTLFLIIFSLLIMFSMNATLSWIALAFMPVTIAYSGFFFKRIARKFQAADEAEGAATAMVQENLTGVRVVRAFGREKFEIDRFDEKINRFTNMWVRLGNTLGLYWGMGDFFCTLQVMVIIVAGCFQAAQGQLTNGEFLAFISYNSMLVWPVRNFGRILSELSKTNISASRLLAILRAKPEQDLPDAKCPSMDGDIVFHDVSFRYNETKEVLSHINLTIKSGTTFGILGATGSGKSTLMYLLDRLYELPTENGTITIGGVDIRHIALPWLRGHIGIVLQEPFLFSKTLRETISDGAKNRDMEAIRHCARLAAIDDTIQNFSEGYETLIGERGVTISGGQKQRVAIARMLMQNTPIKIFDDSLSAVDMETDAKIRDAIQTSVRGTTILIAHRITTLMNADCIAVMDHGKIVQLGSHQDLIKEDGIYRRIYEAQGLGKEAAAL